MAPYDPKDDLEKEEDGDSTSTTGDSSSGTGGSAGEIVFRFPDLITQRRDDQLPAREIERLLQVEFGIHKGLVDNQKRLLKDRQAVKEGKKPSQAYKTGLGLGYGQGSSHYKAHPQLSSKPQFAGADRQMAMVPDLNQAQTNNDKQQKNELRLSPKQEARLENSPRYTPRLTPYK